MACRRGKRQPEHADDSKREHEPEKPTHFLPSERRHACRRRTLRPRPASGSVPLVVWAGTSKARRRPAISGSTGVSMIDARLCRRSVPSERGPSTQIAIAMTAPRHENHQHPRILEPTGEFRFRSSPRALARVDMVDRGPPGVPSLIRDGAPRPFRRPGSSISGRARDRMRQALQDRFRIPRGSAGRAQLARRISGHAKHFSCEAAGSSIGP